MLLLLASGGLALASLVAAHNSRSAAPPWVRGETAAADWRLREKRQAVIAGAVSAVGVLLSLTILMVLAARALIA